MKTTSSDSESDSTIPAITAGTSIRLTKPQRALLTLIEKTPEEERFDLITKVDRSVVDSLVKKGVIELRTIPRSQLRGDLISLDGARMAVIAAMKQHPRREESAEDSDSER